MPPDLPKSSAEGTDGPITKETCIPLAIRRLNFYNNPDRKETEDTIIRSSREPAQVTITPPPEEET